MSNLLNKVSYLFVTYVLEEKPVDLTQDKGIYFGDDTKKFQDVATGAHFNFSDLCARLDHMLK